MGGIDTPRADAMRHESLSWIIGVLSACGQRARERDAFASSTEQYAMPDRAGDRLASDG
jgi:hypothetical protein